MAEDREGGQIRVGKQLRFRQVNRHRQIGAHLFGYVDRNVIEQSAVGVDGIFGADGGEDSGQRHGGSQSQRQRSAAENLGLFGNQVGGYAGERSGEIIEALDLRVGSRDLVENQRDLLARIEALGKLHSLAQSKLQAVGISAGILFAAVCEVVKGRLPRHYLVPRNTIHDLAHLDGIMSGGVNPADQATHAGAGNVVNRYVMFLHPGNDTDVRQSERTSTLQDQTDLRPVRFC